MRALTYIFLIISSLSYAQIGGSHYDKQMDYAKSLIDIGDYKNAYNNLIELYQIDSTDTELNFWLGYTSFYANRDKNIALPYLEKGKQFNGNANYLLGIIYHQKEDFENTQRSFNAYKNLVFEEKMFTGQQVENEIQKIKVAKELIKNKTDYKVENIGALVNSAYPDYAPIIYANGFKLMFTSRRSGTEADKKDPNNEYFEDIYLSEKVNNEWQKPVNIGSPINSATHDAAVTLSQNDSVLYFYRTSPNLVGGDIFTSRWINDKWSDPQLFNLNINSKTSSESSLCMNPDGDIIYFSSNREGGYGGKDLYCLRKLPNGAWSLPVNLGGMVNSPEDEDGPYVSLDGQTLFFSSKGHQNMGGYDLYSTQLDEYGNWTEPKNLGYPINSVADDIFISTLDQVHFFFSSNRSGGFGFADIYQTIIPKEKNDFLIVKGRVIDHSTQGSIPASITVLNKRNNKLEGLYKTDPASGKFIMILKPGEQYKMFVEAQGYYDENSIIDLTKSISLEDVLKTIRLTPKTELEE
ncbi:MAG: PD40 domain-containing protein [Bacteroidales bacterium]|nr:PD40 domain-containing protein [Bacteroidales bacterium]